MMQIIHYCCLAVTVPKTGADIGDWLAESNDLSAGLPLDSGITGIVFVAILPL